MSGPPDNESAPGISAEEGTRRTNLVLAQMRGLSIPDAQTMLSMITIGIAVQTDHALHKTHPLVVIAWPEPQVLHLRLARGDDQVLPVLPLPPFHAH